MNRTWTVLALPVATLSIATVVLSSPAGSTTELSTPATTALPQTVVDLPYAETGAAIAVTKTNWQETGNSSVTTPISPPGRPKR